MYLASTFIFTFVNPFFHYLFTTFAKLTFVKLKIKALN